MPPLSPELSSDFQKLQLPTVNPSFEKSYLKVKYGKLTAHIHLRYLGFRVAFNVLVELPDWFSWCSVSLSFRNWSNFILSSSFRCLSRYLSSGIVCIVCGQEMYLLSCGSIICVSGYSVLASTDLLLKNPKTNINLSQLVGSHESS